MYAYCGNDPINHTDPNGLFFGWLKSLFKKIGKALAAIANVIAKVLNNKWVSWIMIGVTALVGLPGITNILGKALFKVLQTAAKIYKAAQKVLTLINTAAGALQGKFRSIAQAVFDSTYFLDKFGLKGLSTAIKKGGDIFQRALNVYDTVRTIQAIADGGFKVLKGRLINAGLAFLKSLPDKFTDEMASRTKGDNEWENDISTFSDLRRNFGSVLLGALRSGIGFTKYKNTGAAILAYAARVSIGYRNDVVYRKFGTVSGANDYTPFLHRKTFLTNKTLDLLPIP
jgi:hypothetical protein